jgi:hypothetical protein
MSNLPAILGWPVSIVDPHTGQQYQIPSSLISFNSSTGVPFVTLPGGSPLAPFNDPTAKTPPGSIVPDLLATLVNEGLLTPGTAAPVQGPTVTARDTGSQGNGISVTFSNPVPGVGGSADLTGVVDVSVSVTQVYTGLSGVFSFTPGLVQLSAAPSTEPPASGVVAPTSSPITWPVQDAPPASGTTFVLLPKNTGSSDSPADIALISVTVVAPTGTPQPPFSIFVRWAKRQTKVPLGSLLSQSGFPASPFAYVITLGGSLLLPNAGIFTLTGGSDSPATAASATTLASAT